MTAIDLATDLERLGLEQYLMRLVALDNRAVVRLQASGTTMGVWSGPPFEVVALRPTVLAAPADFDLTVSAQRLLDRLGHRSLDLPDLVSGPSWVGLLPPRSGWDVRMRGDVANVRAAVEAAKQFFKDRADGITDPARLEAIAHDVWERSCLAEVPVRCAHAAEALGMLGPGEGEAIAYGTDTWLRLAVPGGSVATRRGLLPSIPVFAR